MPETWGRPSPNSKWWTNPMALEALAQREGDEYGLRNSGVLTGQADEPESFNASEEDAHRAGTRRSKRSRDTVAAAIADAMGEDYDLSDLDLDNLDDVIDAITYDAAEPEAALAALDDVLRAQQPRVERAAPGESSRAYVVAEQSWREEKGLSRKRHTVPPSQTPDARRRRRLRKLVEAGRFASIEQAERMVPRRLPRSA